MSYKNGNELSDSNSNLYRLIHFLNAQHSHNMTYASGYCLKIVDKGIDQWLANAINFTPFTSKSHLTCV